MAAPDRRVILDAFRVMPHAVGVDDAARRRLDDIEHQPVDVLRHAGDHVARRLAQPLRPIAPHQLVIAADAAGGDDDRLRAQRERAGKPARTCGAALGVARLQHIALHAIDRRRRSLLSPVTRWRKRNVTSPRLSASRTRRTNGSITPGPVPQVTWKRGTELPCPVARYPPRSAQPTIGKISGPAHATRRASRPRRNPHRPRPSGAANDPRRGRSRPSRASPAAQALASRGCADAAARAS